MALLFEKILSAIYTHERFSYFSLAEITIDDRASEEPESSEEQVVKEACDELTEHFKHRLIEALLRSTRHSLDIMRKRFLAR